MGRPHPSLCRGRPGRASRYRCRRRPPQAWKTARCRGLAVVIRLRGVDCHRQTPGGCLTGAHEHRCDSGGAGQPRSPESVPDRRCLRQSIADRLYTSRQARQCVQEARGGLFKPWKPPRPGRRRLTVPLRCLTRETPPSKSHSAHTHKLAATRRRLDRPPRSPRGTAHSADAPNNLRENDHRQTRSLIPPGLRNTGTRPDRCVRATCVAPMSMLRKRSWLGVSQT